jgi:hypothetical protein
VDPRIRAIGHDGQVLQPWLHAGTETRMIDDRTREILLQATIDIPHHLAAVNEIGLH